MKAQDLNMEWARAHVEAMADGSLTGVERYRMRRAMHADPELRDAVERARRLRREIRQLARARVPGRLARRLLRIPGPRQPRFPVAWGVPAAAAAAGAAVATAALLGLQTLSQPSAERELAMQEFRVAMSYLQRSAVATSDDVTRSLTNGFRDALAVSRSAVLETGSESQNGDQSDDQE